MSGPRSTAIHAWDDGSVAARAWRYRQRKSRGLFEVKFDVDQAQIKSLIARGFLPIQRRGNKDDVAAATEAALRAFLSRNWQEFK